MKKCSKCTKEFCFLLAIICLLTLSSCFVFVKATTNDFTFNLELLEQEINASPDECWRNPAHNRKNAMCNKLIELQELIDVENFEEAYEKLLYDIKPKLTGLKTDEHEQPWGNGVYDQAWIICENLRETFRGECNIILAQINPQSVYDDDKTPPDISIIYVGEQYVNNPGVWHVDISDAYSGLDIVIINVNAVEEIYDLQGDLSVSYVIPVPAIVGINTIVVTATNDDKDFEGDQETSSESDWVTIINTPTGTDVEVSDEDTGVDIIFSEVSELGITNVEVNIEGPEPPSECIAVSNYFEITTGATFSGTITIAIPYDVAQFSVDEQFLRLLHWNTISMVWDDITTNVDIVNDIIYGEVTELSTFLITADINSPLIDHPADTSYLCGSTGNTITWIATDENPGNYLVSLDGGDYLSGIWESGVPIIINIDSLSIGAYEFKIKVSDDSDNYVSDIVNVNVYEDDDSPPVILIERKFPNGWNVYIEDLESGIDEVLIDINGVEYVHDINMDGIITLAYYNIYAPGTSGMEAHITVTAKNNDKDYDGDQEVNMETDSIIIIAVEETDIDWTPPVVLIAYEGGYTDTNPGIWHIDIEDPESGLYEILITLNGVEQVFDQNLNGIISMNYDIMLPGIADIYMITVVAKNNDYDHDTTTKSQLVDINLDPAPPSDDDITGPTIIINYALDGNYYGVWRIYVEDLESGLDYIQITLDGIDFIYDSNLNGIMSKLYQIDAVIWNFHTIEIFAVNYDKDYNGDEELSIAFGSVYIDNTAPTIDISYQGDGTVSSPGIWQITVEDTETGIDIIYVFVDGVEEIYDFNGEISVLLDIQVPGTIGTHIIEVTAINNDKDYDGDQESATESSFVIIDDDNTAPIITIERKFPNDWNVFIEDLESGVDEVLIVVNGIEYVHDDNLNGIISLAYYNIHAPGTLGMEAHITVTAKNNDKDYDGDQEVNMETNSFIIIGVLETDIDWTAPVVLIAYEGGYTDTNPGMWHIDIEDPESGLYEILITLNGVEQVFDQNMGGIISMHYDIILPGIADIYMITVVAKNNDYDHDTTTKTQLVDINLDPVPPSDDDITGPTIIVDYALDDFNTYSEGVWRIYVEDLESGLDYIQITLDGMDFIYDSNLNGITSKFYQIDGAVWKFSNIQIHAVNYDKDYNGDEELSIAFGSVYVDNTAPTIDILYQGDGTISSPGIWQITVEDTETGIDMIYVFVDGVEEIYDFNGEISVLLDIQVPETIGTHTIEVTAINNDKDYDGDQESAIESSFVIIDDDNTAPIIYIEMKSFNRWNVFIEDLESGIDEVLIEVNGIEYTHDVSLNGIISLSYYNIYAPGYSGMEAHITVTAKNNDKDYDGDQEVNMLTDYIIIVGVKIIDIDWTPPVVLIAYEGGYTDTNPGIWHIDIEDPESGLYEVLITLNGVEEVFDQNMGGIISMHYDINIPGIANIYTITVAAKNNDLDHDRTTKTQLVDINPDPAPPSDDDITGPTIIIDYALDAFNPHYEGVWRIYVEDLESGLDYIHIKLDGRDFIYDSNLNGITSKLYQIDGAVWKSHTIEIFAVNYDKDYNGDEELSIAFKSVCVDNTAPTIDVSYQGDGTVSSPGIWQIIVEDLETGIDIIHVFVDGVEDVYEINGEISILLDIQVPGTIGTHAIEVTAINNDKDYVGDQESATESSFVIIDDDNTAPIISIEEKWIGWDVFIEDLESGIDEILIDINGYVYLHEENLNGIISLAFYNIIPDVAGTYTISVVTKNNDKDFEGDQEISTESDTIVRPAIETRVIIQDFTAPLILIAYEGGYTDINPGTWHIDVEDLESGLDEVQITLNGVEQVFDQNLNGIISMHYDIILPGIADIYTITVIATNYDIEYTQDTSTKSQLVDINTDPAPPSDDDITGPSIIIDYTLDGYYYGVWRVYVEDPESGLDYIHIELDDTDFIYDTNLNGITSKFYQIDTVIWKFHTIEIFAVNYDKDYNGDEELSLAFKSVYVDNTAPTIDISYQGDGTVSSPGIWQVTIEDLETGIDIIHVFVDGVEEVYDFNGETSTLLNIQVPGTFGTHTIEVTAINNDNDYVGDQESATESDSVNIIELTPPTIIINYVGDSNMDNPGVWNVYVEDDGSGIDTVQIYIDGVIIFDEQLGGIPSKSYDNIAVPAVETTHTITVIVKDSHQNEAQMSQDKQILPRSSPPPPPIIIG